MNIVARKIKKKLYEPLRRTIIISKYFVELLAVREATLHKWS